MVPKLQQGVMRRGELGGKRGYSHHNKLVPAIF